MLIARRSVLLGLTMAGLQPRLAAAAIQIIEAGNVLAVTGESTGQLEGRTRLLAAGESVFINDMLGTGIGARLAVQLGEATKLSLGERTRIRIDKFLVDRGGELVLERGSMLFDRPDNPPSGPLNVTTPFGLIAARGTRFFAGPSNGVFGIFVEHGLVSVRTRAGEIVLSDGQGTDLTDPTLPPTPAKTWTPLRIAEAEASVL